MHGNAFRHYCFKAELWINYLSLLCYWFRFFDIDTNIQNIVQLYCPLYGA